MNPLRITLVLTPLLLLGAIQAQGKPAKKTPNKQIPIKVKELKALVKKRKGQADPGAVQVIGEITGMARKGIDKDRALVAKEVGKILNKVKRKPNQTVLFKAAIDSLGHMGKYGAAPLAKAAGNKKFKHKDWVTLRSDIVRALGRTKESKHTKLLMDLMVRDPYDQINAAAVEALGNFYELPQKKRKDIVEAVVRFFSDVDNGANSTEANDLATEALKRKRAIITGPCNKTLQALTPMKFTKPLDWHKWYQNNKKKKWGSPGGLKGKKK